MDKCPHCEEESITTWQKGWSTWFNPAVCSECGKPSKMEPKYGLEIYKIPILVGLILWPSVIYFESGWPLVLFVPAVIFPVRKHLSRSILSKAG